MCRCGRHANERRLLDQNAKLSQSLETVSFNYATRILPPFYLFIHCLILFFIFRCDNFNFDSFSNNFFLISTRKSRLVFGTRSLRTDKCVLATSGMQADALALHALLRARLTMYEHDHGKQMPTPAIAQMLANNLYYRRFFPYYCFNVVGGIDEQGNGSIFLNKISSFLIFAQQETVSRTATMQLARMNVSSTLLRARDKR